MTSSHQATFRHISWLFGIQFSDLFKIVNQFKTWFPEESSLTVYRITVSFWKKNDFFSAQRVSSWRFFVWTRPLSGRVESALMHVTSQSVVERTLALWNIKDLVSWFYHMHFNGMDTVYSVMFKVTLKWIKCVCFYTL